MPANKPKPITAQSLNPLKPLGLNSGRKARVYPNPCALELHCAGYPLSQLRPYGLTGQMSLQTWLAQGDFFHQSALHGKVFFKENL